MEGFTLDDVRRLLQEELARAAQADGWLTSKKAAEYLGISVPSLHNAVSAGRIVRHGEPGTALRFRRTDLDAYVAARRG